MYEISLQKLNYTILSFSFKNSPARVSVAYQLAPLHKCICRIKVTQRMSCRLSGAHTMFLTSYFFYDWNDTIRGLHTIV